uniref:Aldo-keto reductase n=1 Tax=Mycena chlorophos TaxID=658473 RepID=A0ABQ0LE50_MYCCL|nr:aldo-keto reductase [Mycena chlorophos]
MPFGKAKLNDGHEIPTIAFGTGSVNKGHDVTQISSWALEAGFDHLDTAQYYQTEATLGKAIYESGLPRSELYITSKYGFGDVKEAFNASLNNLKTTYLDLYLIHNPRSIPPSEIPTVWTQLEALKDAGLTRSIGVSNFDLAQLQDLVKTATKYKPAVNQIQFHPYNYAQNKALLEFAAEHGIVVEAYSPLAPITQYPGGPVDAPLKAAAERLGITPTQVLFLWAKAKGVVIVTTSSSKQHMEEYLAVGDLPPLTHEEVAAIDAAGARGPANAFVKLRRHERVLVLCRILALAYIFWAYFIWRPA